MLTKEKAKQRGFKQMSSLLLRGMLFASIAVINLLFFFTTDADAQFRRGRYVLKGSFGGEYEIYSFEDNNNTRERVRYLEYLNMDLAGHIIHPRIIGFNTGFTIWYDNPNSTDNDTESKDKSLSLGYNINFSFFPTTWFPFTLFANRSTVDTVVSHYPSATTTATSYGGTLALKFIRLPEMSMYYNLTNSESDNPLYQSEFETQNYGITLSKSLERWWNSYITGGYISTDSEDKTAGTTTANNVYHLSETSKISKTTLLDMNALLNDYSSESSGSTSKSQYMSFHAGLSMQPYKRFSHGYSYDFSDSESSSTSGTESETTSHSFSGSARYLILKEWPIDGRFRYAMTDSSDTDAETKSTDFLDTAVTTSFKITKDWSGSGGLAYYIEDTSSSDGDASATDKLDIAANVTGNITKDWSAGSSLSYYTSDTSSSTEEDSSSKSITGTAGTRYSTKIRFLDIWSGYSLGYSSLSNDPGEDTRTTAHLFNTGLGSSYKGRYTSVSGSYGLAYSTSSTGDDGITHNVSLSASNTYLTRTTINASANWYFGDTTTIVESSKGNGRSAKLSIASDYFRRVRISANANYGESHVEKGQISTSTQEVGTRTSEFTGALATSSSVSKSWSAGAAIDMHLGRRFGNLLLSGTHSGSETTGGEVTGGYTNISETTEVSLSHNMQLTKRLSSQESIAWNDSSDDTYGTLTDTTRTTASAVISYGIGKWTLSATYNYSLINEETGGSISESTEQKFMFNVKRTFKLFL